MNGSRFTYPLILPLVSVLLGSVVAARADAQWTVTYSVDDQQAAQALGEERVPPMRRALGRVKRTLEGILAGSTGAATFVVSWENPSGTAIGQALIAGFAAQSVSVARDKLINQASADGEPEAEINLYDLLPTPNVPFFYDGSTQQSVATVVIPSALNRHLQFQTSGSGSDATIKVRPPSASLEWQFWTGKLKDGHELFEVVMVHESLHALGFLSVAENATVPSSLTSWDLFRIPEASVPVTAVQFTTVPRELRPTVEASWVTRLNSSAEAYKASRGTRTGGDDNQAPHWRSVARLDPAVVIGAMDPAATTGVIHGGLSHMFVTRADVNALDMMGWNVDPNGLDFAAGDGIELLAPTAAAAVRPHHDVLFDWQTGKSTPYGWTLFIYQGTQAVDDFPYRVYDELQSTQFTLPAGQSLPPGEYVWYVVGNLALGCENSEDRRLTVLCTADFDMSGFVDTDDFDAFVVAFVAGDESSDVDGSGFVDHDDYDFFVLAYESGC
ncbi:MAG: NF038122 family metalloprotease [Phycisphaerales bacterium]|nr:NF038122 family metalloprotease [Phycisphaerales bacterium]